MKRNQLEIVKNLKNELSSEEAVRVILCKELQDCQTELQCRTKELLDCKVELRETKIHLKREEFSRCQLQAFFSYMTSQFRTLYKEHFGKSMIILYFLE